ncbi:hypothetical protein JIX56_19370 [Streptomyces sp. CA-210063]|uniref:hypothetical protein n=1 Tax=Streptomyces sp. CA-210063 TaxID=2801029 RepID=UPI00214C9DC8|nr:hypothetical protein [Streptomyces sp. CA-210063]UUU31889.1 hypothetical protein JIX56_19370 [Streptomyces sp. CA-210063]
MSREVTVEEVRDQLLASGIGVDFQDGRLTVLHDGSVAWIGPNLDVELEREYEPDELAVIEGLIGTWNGFVIDYRTIGVADAVVTAMCERWPCVVDDEDGFIGWGVDYLERRRDGGYVPHSTS